MKKAARWIFPLTFLLLCAAVTWFLHLFMVTDKAMTYIDWQSAVQITENGDETPYGLDEYTNMPGQMGTFRFTTRLPEGLGNGYLLFEISGLDLSLSLNGDEIYSSAATLSEGTSEMAAVNVPLPENATGELTMTCTILDLNSAMFPPLLRFIPDGMNEAQLMSYANLYGIPSAVSATALLLVAGLFLLSMVRKKVEWSLIPLMVALVGLTTYRLIQSCGYYFLPEAAVRIFSWRGFVWLAPLAFAVYLVMNRRRDFWRLLGLTVAWSTGALLVTYLTSLAGGWYLSTYINSAIAELFEYGVYDGLLYWFTLWLAVVCALISAYWLMHSFVQHRMQAQALALKNRLILDSYHAIEQKMQDSAVLRHEFRHQLTALDALYQQRDFNQLGKLLRELKQQDAMLAQTHFTENFTVNAILQDAASRAARAGTAFSAQVHIPEELPLPGNDLCTLLMNMLDNALEACERVEKLEERFIRFKAEVKSDFLAIKCENRYTGTLKEDEHGRLQTTKLDAEAHGFGLSQMSAMAEKYHSLLDISYTEDYVFVVQTALKLPKKKQI